MLEEIHHNCGIAAIYDLDPDQETNVATLVPEFLLDLQHRGQLAAGMTTYNPDRDRLLYTYKDTGTVNEVFRMGQKETFENIMKQYRGIAAIGHVRYATSGRDESEYAQPFETYHGRRWKWFSLGFNGNIANFLELRKRLMEKRGYHMIYNVDTEILSHYMAFGLRGNKKKNLISVFSELSESLDGAYNIVLLNADGDMAVVRDPMAMRPICYGLKNKIFAAASESIVLKNFDIEEIHFLNPGEMVLIDGKTREITIRQYAHSNQTASCFFEWVYFSHVSSILDGYPVYSARVAFGQTLAELETEMLDSSCVAVPVPDTAKPAGDAYAFQLKIPSMEAIVRNRYIGRTFIEGSDRFKKAVRKYTLQEHMLKNKRVFLVEDSIVRSTTVRALIQRIRKAGAKEVHLRVACPPIVAPCYYGIHIPSIKELFAPQFMKTNFASGVLPDQMLKQMASSVDADSLIYLPVKAVSDGIGIPENSLCRACITGNYPTFTGQKLYKAALKKWSAQEK
jgi:amidophosphoribosyltransferase